MSDEYPDNHIKEILDSVEYTAHPVAKARMIHLAIERMIHDQAERITTLEAALREIIETWALHWDCSGSPGHHEVNKAMANCNRALTEVSDTECAYCGQKPSEVTMACPDCTPTRATEVSDTEENPE